MSGVRSDQPLQPVGEIIRFVVPTAPMAAALAAGRAVLAADLNTAFGWRAQDAEGTRVALEYGLHSLISVPLQARGVVLGMANFWRADTPDAFDEEDLSFAEELGRAPPSRSTTPAASPGSTPRRSRSSAACCPGYCPS